MTTDSAPVYEAPRIEDHGTLREITAGLGKEGELDAHYPHSIGYVYHMKLSVPG